MPSKTAACAASACAVRQPIPTCGRSTSRCATMVPHRVTSPSRSPSAPRSMAPEICPSAPSASRSRPAPIAKPASSFAAAPPDFCGRRLLPHDAFPADDRVTLQLPAQPALRVTVYSAEPDLLRPVLAASPQVVATFRAPSEYNAQTRHRSSSWTVSIRPRRRRADSVWIDPPPGGSPVPVRARVSDAPLTHWLTDHPLGAGLRAKDLRLESASVFEAAPGRSEDRRGGRRPRHSGASRQAQDRRAGLSSGPLGDAL